MLRALPEHPGLAVEIAETGLHLRMTGDLGPALEVITDRLGCPQPALPTRAASPADAIQGDEGMTCTSAPRGHSIASASCSAFGCRASRTSRTREAPLASCWSLNPFT
ncbi:hypothetical protein P354_31095 [Streptomyces noursei PD-1]|nr:hypothetical protein P354_31095 [Streptomyces noursei PD-1]